MATQIPFDRLKGRENYAEWKIGAKAHLIIKGLWKHCLQEPTSTATTAEMASDLRALGEITLLLEPSNYTHIDGKENAKEAWDSLEKAFEDKGVGRRVAVLQQLVSLKQKDCASMEEYVQKMCTLWAKVKSAGFKIDEEVAGSLILVGLPAEFKAMVLAIENSGTAITVDYVKNLLLQGIMFDNETDKAESALATMKHKGKKKPRGRSCYECGSTKHYIRDCPQSKSEKDKNAKKKQTPALFSSFLAQSTEKESDWFIDSGCTTHMTKHKTCLVNISHPEQKEVVVANSDKLDIDCVGDISQCVLNNGKREEIEIKRVHYVPNICANLLSVSQIVKRNNTVLFTKNGCKILNANNKVIATASLIDDLFKLDTVPNAKVFCADTNNSNICEKTKENLLLWHRRFGHASFDYMKFLKGTINDFAVSNRKVCVTCIQGKQTRLPFKHEGNRASQLLELVHSDVCGPFSVNSFSGKRYFVTFVDDFSRKLFVYAMKQKSEVFEHFLRFKNMVEKQTGQKLKFFRSDNGTEFCNHNFKSFFEKHGIVHQRSTINTPQQNGVAERINRTIIEKVRCMLLDAGLEKNFWAEAVMTAAYLINRIPCKGSGIESPEEIWSSKKPDFGFLKVFGCRAYAQILSNKRKKLDSKAAEYTFVGYAENTKAYRLFDKRSKTIIISRDVTFLESTNDERVIDFEIDKANNFCLSYDENSGIVESGRVNDDDDPTIGTNGDELGRPAGSSTPEAQRLRTNVSDGYNTADELSEVDNSNDIDYEPDETIDESLGTRRSNRNANKEPPVYNNFAFAFAVCDPMTVKQAMSSKDSYSWQEAMKQEYESLKENETWTLVELPKGKSPVECKWVFKSKTDINGNVIRYKARLVAKGFTQIEGIDYHETFSPVVRYSSIRYLMAIAAKLDLNIRQLDVVTAFLHGKLDEEVFMTQPETFHDGTNRFCKLQKSIYGLKQSSRVWNNTLNKTLLDFGLKRSTADQCIYHSETSKGILIVAIYVDDILVFSNDSEIERKLVDMLRSQFKMKDMGGVSSVLGVRVIRNRKNGTISLDQSQYIGDILRRFKMDECKDTSTPMDSNQKFMANTGPNVNKQMKNIPFRQAIGALLFCAQVTRPDINYAVNALSRYNEKPDETHWTGVKRIFRYLKGSIDRKITYKKDSSILEGFCDADWGSDEETRKSTTGYVFTLQSGAITWCTRRQKTVALSTTEAEFQSMVAAIQEAIWLKRMELEIFPNATKTLVLHCDNRGAIQLATNNSYSARTKHIDIKEKFVREKLESGDIQLRYLRTDEMPADILTKAVTKQKLNSLSLSFGLK